MRPILRFLAVWTLREHPKNFLSRPPFHPMLWPVAVRVTSHISEKWEGRQCLTAAVPLSPQRTSNIILTPDWSVRSWMAWTSALKISCSSLLLVTISLTRLTDVLNEHSNPARLLKLWSPLCFSRIHCIELHRSLPWFVWGLSVFEGRMDFGGVIADLGNGSWVRVTSEYFAIH